MIYTLGTGSRTLEEFLELLRETGVEQVCDVRSFPTSSRFPHFARESLESALAARGFGYVWLGNELGGYRKGGYLAYMKTEDFGAGLEELERLAAERVTALVCAERLPWRCHRRFISEALRERGWKVIHLIDKGRVWTGNQEGTGLKGAPRLFD